MTLFARGGKERDSAFPRSGKKQERQKKKKMLSSPFESESEKEIFVISDSFIARVGGPK